MVALPESSIQVTSHLRLLTPAFTHASFIGLQERFLASLEMTIRERLMSPSLQSLATSPQSKNVLYYG